MLLFFNTCSNVYLQIVCYVLPKNNNLMLTSEFFVENKDIEIANRLLIGKFNLLWKENYVTLQNLSFLLFFVI